MYPTDLTETQWQYIKKVLLPQKRKRKHDLKEIWNAIFYLVRTNGVPMAHASSGLSQMEVGLLLFSQMVGHE